MKTNINNVEISVKDKGTDTKITPDMFASGEAILPRKKGEINSEYVADSIVQNIFLELSPIHDEASKKIAISKIKEYTKDIIDLTISQTLVPPSKATEKA